MKNKLRTTLIALAGVGFFANPAMAVVSLENGGLSLAFYQVTPGIGGGTVGPQTLIVDLGAASLYRENTGYNVSVSTVNPGFANSNIGSQLTTAFGANWADSGTIRWMAFGTVTGVSSPISGDPNRTTYLSTARADFSTNTVPINIAGGSLRGGVSNSIANFVGQTQNEVATVGNADVTQTPITDIFSIDQYVAPTTPGLWFTLGQDITQTLDSGTISGPDGLVFEGALDIYRVLNTTSGADLTAGYSGSDAAIGLGQYQGTITLDGAGNLSLIPEPSAALLGLIGTFGLVLRRRRNA